MNIGIVFRAFLTLLASLVLQVEVWALIRAADTQDTIKVRCIFGAVSDRRVFLDISIINSYPFIFRLSTINEIWRTFNISLVVVVRFNTGVHVFVENTITATSWALHTIKRKETIFRTWYAFILIEKWSFDWTLLCSLHFRCFFNLLSDTVRIHWSPSIGPQIGIKRNKLTAMGG